MVGGRDLLHEDKYVRVGSVQYVKDTIDMIKELGGKILTVVPSTVGKVTPMGRPRTSGDGRSRASRSARITPRSRVSGSGSSRSTASRRTSSAAVTRRSRSPMTSAATVASASTPST